MGGVINSSCTAPTHTHQLLKDLATATVAPTSGRPLQSAGGCMHTPLARYHAFTPAGSQLAAAAVGTSRLCHQAQPDLHLPLLVTAGGCLVTHLWCVEVDGDLPCDPVHVQHLPPGVILHQRMQPPVALLVHLCGTWRPAQGVSVREDATCKDTRILSHGDE